LSVADPSGPQDQEIASGEMHSEREPNRFEQNVAPKSQSPIDIVETFDVVAPKQRRRSWNRWRLKRDWPILALLAVLFGGWLIYAVILPPIEIRHKIATTRWKYSPSDPEISYAVRFMLRTCEYWFLFWFLYLGASIGSFINVVASRTPRGKTIVTRGSHCPFCDVPLNMLDNSPLFGWVLLRGRCRSCHLPISPRYVGMEIAVGLIFMTLAGVELFSNGWNIPYRDWSFGSGMVQTVFYPKWDLIGAYVAHCSLFAVAMMLIGSQLDRLRFPVLPLAVIAAIYIVSVSSNRVLCPIRWNEPFGPGFLRFQSDWRQQAITSLIGAASGLGIGVAMSQILSRTVLRVTEDKPVTNSMESVNTTNMGTTERIETEIERAEGQGRDQPAIVEAKFQPNSLSVTPLPVALPTESSSSESPSESPSESSLDALQCLENWRLHSIALSVLAGALLGWQAVATIAIASLLLTLSVLPWIRSDSEKGSAMPLFLRQQVIALAAWTITLFFHHVAWRQVAHWLHIG
jgi:prepilin signal peptidase PulO-like enzyme (type II secretory pathway)